MFEIVDDYGKNALHIKNCLSKEECEQILKFIELNNKSNMVVNISLDC